MMSFPVPEGADAKSRRAIKAMEAKLGHLTISKPEVTRIIDAVMKDQKPRDEERARKAEEKQYEQEERRRLKALYRSRR